MKYWPPASWVWFCGSLLIPEMVFLWYLPWTYFSHSVPSCMVSSTAIYMLKTSSPNVPGTLHSLLVFSLAFLASLCRPRHHCLCCWCLLWMSPRLCLPWMPPYLCQRLVFWSPQCLTEVQHPSHCPMFSVVLFSVLFMTKFRAVSEAWAWISWPRFESQFCHFLTE